MTFLLDIFRDTVYTVESWDNVRFVVSIFWPDDSVMYEEFDWPLNDTLEFIRTEISFMSEL